MDTALWILQILVALGFIAAGVNHITGRDKATGRMAWMIDVPKTTQPPVTASVAGPYGSWHDEDPRDGRRRVCGLGLG